VAVLGGASIFGMAWSIAGRRPVEAARMARAEPVGPVVGEPERTTPRRAPATGPVSPVASGRIDINVAGEAELQLLSGIGPTLASRIVADREANGPYSSVDELQRVRGIGERTVEKVREMATVGGEAGSAERGGV
jgi:competence protein ComEA